MSQSRPQEYFLRMEFLPAFPVGAVDPSTLSLETRIALLARTLWEDYGRPDDCDITIWMEAERRVLRVIESASELAFGAASTSHRRLAC